MSVTQQSSQAGKCGWLQHLVLDRCDEWPRLFGFGHHRSPRRVTDKGTPLCFAFCERIPSQHVVQHLVRIAYESCPEADCANPMLLEQRQSRGFEALEDLRQRARRTRVLPQFM